MVLIFDIVKSGKNKPHFKTLRFDHKGGSIGRSENCTYQLTDPQNYISGNHIFIEFSNNQYYIRDESTNGTFLKNPYKKIAKGVDSKINTSDIYIIGDHELQVRFDDESLNEYIVGNSILEPEPISAIQELIPDDDFLYVDETKQKVILTGKEENQPTLNIMSFVDSEPLVSTFIEDDLFDNEEEIIPKNIKGALSESIKIPSIDEKPTRAEPIKVVTKHTSQVENKFLKVLESKLEVDFSTYSDIEIERVCVEVVETAFRSFDGIRHLVNIKNKNKDEIFLSNISNYNTQTDLKATSSFFKELKAVEYTNKAIQSINTHLLASNGATNFIIKSAIEEFEPKNIEKKINNKQKQSKLLPQKMVMWQYYEEMFRDTKNIETTLLTNFQNEYKKIESLVQLSNLSSMTI